MKAYLFILLFLCSAQAVEVVDIEKKLPNIKTKTKFLEMLVIFKFIEKPNWRDGEALGIRSSGELGLSTISFTPTNSKSIKSIEFIGKDSKKNLGKSLDRDEANIVVTSIVIETPEKYICYTFNDALSVYKLSYEEIKKEGED